jgi:hypothetical protein
MEKTAVVKEVKALKTKDEFGNNSFVIKFENGDEGFYRTKSDHADKFKVGESILYVLEEKDGKSGKKYFKVSLPKPAFTPQQGGNYGGSKYTPKTVHQMKQEARAYILSYAKDMAVGKIISEDEIKVKFFEMCEMYDEAIDKLGEGK